MTLWLHGASLAAAFLGGTALGWSIGKLLEARMPNPFMATVVLVAGSLGGPALTARLMNPGMFSFGLALTIAGLSTGLVFWPMGERQGERRWL